MISLKEVFFDEIDEAPKKNEPKTPNIGYKDIPRQAQSDPDFLNQVQKGLGNAMKREPKPVQHAPDEKIPSLSQLAKGAEDKPDGMPDLDEPQDDHPFGHPDFNDPESEPEAEEEPEPQSDPDFLKQVQKGLGNPDAVPDSWRAGQMDKFEPNEKIPSLSQLAQQPGDEQDPALAGMPKFDQEPEENPFGHPDFNMPGGIDPGANLTFPQKTASAVKKTVGSVAAKAGDAIRNFGKDRGTEPMPAMAKTNNPDDADGLPSSWKTPDGEEPSAGANPGDSDDMPTLRSLSRQRFGKDVFKDTSSKWKVGDIVRVGTLDGFRVQRKDPNGWVLQRRDQNYKFIPHGGLFKV